MCQPVTHTGLLCLRVSLTIVSYEIIHTKAIEDGTLTFRKLANDLRKELLKSSTPRAGQVAKGSFGPSFADSDEAD